MNAPSAADLLRTVLLAAAATAGVALLFFGPAIPLGTRLFFTHDLSRSDLWHLHVPLKSFYASELRAGRLPFWCPGLGTGLPLLAEGQVGALSPPNLLLFALLPLPLAFNWSLLLTGLLAGASTAALARQLGASRGASVLAAVVFAFSGFMIAHLKHVNMTAAAAWMPLLLLLLERHAARPRRRHLAGLAVAVALMVLAGHPQIAAYNLLVAAAWGSTLLIRTGVRSRSAGAAARRAAGLGLAVALGLALALPQILPTLELVRHSPRKHGLTFAEATAWDYAPAYLITFLLPRHFGDPGQLAPPPGGGARPAGFRPVPGTRNFFWEICGYVGLGPLGLALAALLPGRRARRAWLLLVLVGLCLLLVLGKHGGLVPWLHDHLPGFNAFRFHDRFLLHVDLGLALLAALGLTRVAGWCGTGRLAGLVSAAAVALTVLDLFLALGDHNPTVDARRWTAPPRTASRILAEEGSRDAPFRIAPFDRPRFVFLNAYHRAGGWKGDLGAYDIAREMLYADHHLLFGLESLDFYHPLYPDALGYAIDAFHAPDLVTGAPPNARLASLFNVRYVLSPFAGVGSNPAFERIATVAGGPEVLHGTGQPCDVHLFRNPGALPRAFLVPRAVAVGGPEPAAAVLARLARPGFDPRREVILAAAPEALPPDRAPADPILAPVRFRRRTPQRLCLEVNAPRDAWLFLSEAWYPGWRATVDGTETPIHPANLAGRAVRVPAGRHEVVFDYVPVSFRRGLAGSALAGIGLVLLLVTRRKRAAGRLIPRGGRG